MRLPRNTAIEEQVQERTKLKLNIPVTMITIGVFLVGAVGALVITSILSKPDIVTCDSVGDAFLAEAPAPEVEVNKLAADIQSATASADTQVHSFTSSSGKNQTEAGVTLKHALEERKRDIFALAAQDPERAARLALNDETAHDLLASTKNCVEQEKTVTAQVELLHGHDLTSGKAFEFDEAFLNDGKIKYQVHTDDETLESFQAGSKIKTDALVLENQAFVYAPQPGSDGTVAPTFTTLSQPATSLALGTQKGIILMGNFSNTNVTSPDVTYMQTVISEVNDYYQENSYGKFSFDFTIHDWATISTPQGTTCDLNGFTNSLIQVVDPSVNFAQYNNTNLAVLAPWPVFNWPPAGDPSTYPTLPAGQTFSQTCHWGGVASAVPMQWSTNEGVVNLTVTWIKVPFGAKEGLEYLMNHEFGHNIASSQHANWLSCPNGVSIADVPTCTSVGYEDHYDVMGGWYSPTSAAYYRGHFNGPRTEMSGWLDPGNIVKEMTTDGPKTVTITPLERPGTGVKLLKIERPSGEYLTVEYRQPKFADGVTTTMDGTMFNTDFPQVFNGALIHILRANTSTDLIDVTPTPTNGTSNPVLGLGQSFTDPKTGSQITVTAKTADALTVTVTPPVIDYFPPPGVAYVNDGSGNDEETTSSTTSLSANWPASADIGSGTASYELELKSSHSTLITAQNNGLATTATLSGLTLTPGELYTVSVTPIDAFGNRGAKVGSNGITVTSGTPPSPSPTAPTAAGPLPPDGVNDGLTKNGSVYTDAKYTRATTVLSANWYDSPDVATVAKYQYAIGTTADGTDVVGYTDIGKNLVMSHWNLSLTNGQKYYVSVRSVDGQGVAGPDISSDGIFVDTSAPPAPAYVRDGTGVDIDQSTNPTGISANWAAVTDPSTVKYQYAIGTTSGGQEYQSYTANTATSFTKVGVPLVTNTTYHISVRAIDGAGNIGTPTTSNGVTILHVNDTTPPTVTVTAPSTGATVAGTVPFSATATDDITMAGVQFQVNGQNIGSEDITNPYSISWNTTGSANGSYTLTAIARDSSNNVTTSAPITVTVANGGGDISPPTASISTPANNATVTGTISIRGILVDNVMPAGAKVKIDGVDLGPEILTSSSFNATWDTTAVSNGSHVITVVARDTSNNVGTSPAVTVTVSNVIPDTTPPVVTVTAPVDGSYVTGSVPLTATATDNIGVLGVTFKVDGSTSGVEDTSAPYSISWDSTAATVGTHTITAVVYDAAGNSATSTAISVTVDRTAPTVSITAPIAAAYVGGSAVTLTATAADANGIAGVQFAVDGTNVGVEVTSSLYTVIWNSTGLSDAAHTITAIARDSAGNLTTSSGVSVTTDNTAPPATTGMRDGTVQGIDVDYSKSLTLLGSNWNAVTDTGSGLNKYERAIGTTPGGTDVSDYFGFTGSFTSISIGGTFIEGVKYYTSVRAVDKAGNIGPSVSTNGVTIDSIAPTVSIAAPTASAVAGGTIVPVTATAADNVGVVSVQFRLDGVNLGALDTTAPFSVNWDTTTVTNGVHTLAAIAKDAATNSTTSSNSSVTVDNIAPTTAVTTPAANAYLRGTTVTLSASAADNTSIAGVQFKVDGTNVGFEDTSFPYSITWDSTSVTYGAHTITAVARDAGGNSFTSSGVSVTVDNIAPTVSVTAPTNASYVIGSSVAVTSTAADNDGVLGVQFMLDGSTLNPEDTATSYSITWNSTSATNGSHALTAVARDAAGNVTTSAAVTVIVDNASPTITLTSPADGSYSRGATVTISANAADNDAVAGVQFKVDGANQGAEDTSAPYSISWNTATETNTSHTIIAVVRDKAGNTTTSSSVATTVDNGLPSVSLTAPINAVYVHGVSVAVSATATDNDAIAGVQFTLDGANLSAEDTTSPYGVTWDTTAVSYGTHTLSATARDKAGNTTTSSTNTITVDNVAPTVNLSAPANGSFIRGMTVGISAAAADNDAVVGVQFTLDGANYGAEDTSSPYSINWDTTTATNATHSITAVARDKAGNVTTATSVTVNVDNVAPTVTITAPAANAFVRGLAVTLSALASDNTFVVGVQFKVDGTSVLAEDTFAPFAGNWDSTTFINGVHTITAVARDAAGNTTTSSGVSITVDNTPPTVSVTAPTNNAFLRGSTVAVDATAIDNDVIAGVQFTLDGSNLSAEDTTSPYGITWNTTTATNGSHTLSAIVRDRAGNTTTATTTTVTVDNVAPVVGFSSLTNGVTLHGSTVAVDATATDNIGVAGVQFMLDGSNLGAEDIVFPYSTTWNTTTATNASHVLTAIARDAAGNTTTTSTLTVVVDNAAPTVAISTPTNSANLPAGSITITASASDNTTVAGVQFMLDASGQSEGEFIGSEVTTAPYTVTWDATLASNGSHTLTAIARDPVGNTTTSAPIIVTINNSVPVVSITAPTAGAAVHGSVSITANASDDVAVAGVQFKLDGTNFGNEDTTSPYDVSWDTTFSTSGNHTLTAVARDNSGNTKTSTPVTVTVDNTSPTVTVTAPLANAYLRGTTVALTATAADNISVAGVQFAVDGTNVGAEDTGTPFAVTWDSTSVGNGNHTVTAIAHDTAGNTTTSSGVSVTVDNAAPVTNVTAPIAAAFVRGTTVAVSANATDNDAVVGVQFKLDGTNLNAEDTVAPFAVTWDTTAVSAGSHSLTSVARDKAGNTTTSSAVVVTVDNVAPTVTVTGPANGSSIRRVVSMDATANDDNAVVGVQFTLDGSNFDIEDTVAPFTTPWDTTTATNASHTVTAIARDASGNTTTSAIVTATVDNQSPTVTVTTPIANVYLRGNSVALAATAADNASIEGVQFTVDGANVGSEDASSPFTINWNTTSASNGTHAIAAVARDAAGNTATSSSISVTVDNVAPTISLTTPIANAIVHGTSTAITATATDNTVVAGVQFTVDGVNVGAEDTTSPFGITWDMTTTTSGVHVLAAVARDAAGNTATASSVSVIVDNTAPTVNVTAPSANAFLRGTAVTLSANAADANGVAGVQFTVDGANVGAEATIAPFTISWDSTLVTNAAHIISAVARDSSGNTAIASTVSVIIDNAAPTVTITSPTEGASFPVTTTLLTASASDNNAVAGVQFTVDGANVGVEDTTAPYTVSWDTVTASNGIHTLAAVARDNAGNTTTSSEVIVTVNNSFPVVVITAPGAGVVVNGTSVAISATASDDVAIIGVQFKLDGVNLGAEDTTAPYDMTWDTRSVLSGSHTLTAIARDGSSNSTTSVPVVVIVDHVVPIVSMTSPVDGSLVKGTAVNVTATASDNTSVSGVQFMLDGVNLGAEDTSSPYIMTWSTVTATPGSHSLSAIARDAGGNTTTASAISVIVDNTAPTISFSAPANNAYLKGSSVSITANATDTNGIGGVQFKLNGVNLGAEDTTAPYGMVWDSTSVSDGNYTLSAVARDTIGNISTTSVSVVVDNTGPAAPAIVRGGINGTQIITNNPTSLSANWDVSTDVLSGVARYEIAIGTGPGLANVYAYTSVGTLTTTTINGLTLLDGTYSISVRAVDVAGNVGVSASTAMSVDTTLPTVSVSSPTPGSILSGVLPIVVTAVDTSGLSAVEYLIDGHVIATDVVGPYATAWDTSLVTDGTHVITARAKDQAGNTATSSSVIVQVKNILACVEGWVCGEWSGCSTSGNQTRICVDTQACGTTQSQPVLQQSCIPPAVVPGVTPPPVVVPPVVPPTPVPPVIPPTPVPIISGGTGGADITPSVVVSTSNGQVVGKSTKISFSTAGFKYARVKFLVDNTVIGTDATSPFAVTWDSRLIRNGKHTFTAQAANVKGAVTTYRTTANVVNILTLAPNAPKNNAAVKGQVTLNPQILGGSKITKLVYILDGFTKIGTRTASPFSISWNTKRVTTGRHTILIQGYDKDGRVTRMNLVVTVKR